MGNKVAPFFLLGSSAKKKVYKIETKIAPEPNKNNLYKVWTLAESEIVKPSMPRRDMQFTKVYPEYDRINTANLWKFQ